MTAPNYSTHPASVRSRLREERKRAGLVLFERWIPRTLEDDVSRVVDEALAPSQNNLRDDANNC
jgi:hypothetical protein